MWGDLALYAVFGALAGLVSGLFGVGGGIIIVPFLAWLFPRQGFPESLVMLAAVATSLATIVVTSISAVITHHRLGAVRWEVVARLAPGILLGALLGTLIAQRLPVAVFKLVFALFLFFVAVGLYRRSNAAASPRLRPRWGWFLGAGSVIGTVSSILGIGGGTLSVPFLLRCGHPIHSAVAISNACGFPLALAGTLSYVWLGWKHSEVPVPSLGYVYLPAFLGIIATSVPFAPVGARLAHRLPTRVLKRAFALVLGVVGSRLLYQSLRLLIAG